MYSDAGTGGCEMNHSLRATGATELFKKGASEKLILKIGQVTVLIKISVVLFPDGFVYIFTFSCKHHFLQYHDT